MSFVSRWESARQIAVSLPLQVEDRSAMAVEFGVAMVWKGEFCWRWELALNVSGNQRSRLHPCERGVGTGQCCLLGSMQAVAGQSPGSSLRMLQDQPSTPVTARIAHTTQRNATHPPGKTARRGSIIMDNWQFWRERDAGRLSWCNPIVGRCLGLLVCLQKSLLVRPTLTNDWRKSCQG